MSGIFIINLEEFRSLNWGFFNEINSLVPQLKMRTLRREVSAIYKGKNNPLQPTEYGSVLQPSQMSRTTGIGGE